MVKLIYSGTLTTNKTGICRFFFRKLIIYGVPFSCLLSNSFIKFVVFQMSYFFSAFYGFFLLFNKTFISFYNFLVLICAEGIQHWWQVMHSFGMGNTCLHRYFYFLFHHSCAEPLQFCTDDGGSFGAKLNVSTNFLGVVSQSSSVKIYELDSHS